MIIGIEMMLRTLTLLWCLLRRRGEFCGQERWTNSTFRWWQQAFVFSVSRSREHWKTKWWKAGEQGGGGDVIVITLRSRHGSASAQTQFSYAACHAEVRVIKTLELDFFCQGWFENFPRMLSCIPFYPWFVQHEKLIFSIMSRLIGYPVVKTSSCIYGYF